MGPSAIRSRSNWGRRWIDSSRCQSARLSSSPKQEMASRISLAVMQGAVAGGVLRVVLRRRYVIRSAAHGIGCGLGVVWIPVAIEVLNLWWAGHSSQHWLRPGSCASSRRKPRSHRAAGYRCHHHCLLLESFRLHCPGSYRHRCWGLRLQAQDRGLDRLSQVRDRDRCRTARQSYSRCWVEDCC